MCYPIFLYHNDEEKLKFIVNVLESYLIFNRNKFRLEFISSNSKEFLTYLIKSQAESGLYIINFDLKNRVNCIEILEKIREIDYSGKIACISNYTDIVTLLIKRKIEPISIIFSNQSSEEFRSDIIDTINLSYERLVGLLKTKKMNFPISVSYCTYNINVKEIILIESTNVPHRLIMKTKYDDYEFYGKLNEIEKQNDLFFRASKSCIINTININKINYIKREIYLDNNLVRTYSTRKGNLVKSMFKK